MYSGNIHNLIESLGASERDVRLRPIARRLSRNVARAFRAQGDAFARELRQFERDFPARVQESIAESMWTLAWNATAASTDDLLSEVINGAAAAAYVIGTEDEMSVLGIRVDFDLQSPEAVSFLRSYGAERVTMINDTTRERIRTIMTQGVENGTPYETLAEQIRIEFRQFGAPAPQRHIRNRAELVALTETANAYGVATRHTAQRIQQQGIALEHRWLTTGDSRVSDGCQQNAAAGWLPFDTPFPSGDMREPRFPGCRCTVLNRRSRRG